MRGKLSPRSTGRAQVEKLLKDLVRFRRNRWVSIRHEFADCLPICRYSRKIPEVEKARERPTPACFHRSRAISLRTTLLPSPPPDDDLHARIYHSRPRRDPLARARAHRGEPLTRARALSGIKTPARFSSGRAKRRRLDARTVATAVVEPSSGAARAEEVKLSSNVLPGTAPSNGPPEDRTFVAKGANDATCPFFRAKRRPPETSKRENGSNVAPSVSSPRFRSRAFATPRGLETGPDTRPSRDAFPETDPADERAPACRSTPRRSIQRKKTKKNFAVRFIGPDRKGLMAGLTQLMFGCGCNILSSNQYVSDDGMFFQRLSIDFSGLFSGADNREALESNIENMARQFDLDSWDISTSRSASRRHLGEQDRPLFVGSARAPRERRAEVRDPVHHQ